MSLTKVCTNKCIPRSFYPLSNVKEMINLTIGSSEHMINVYERGLSYIVNELFDEIGIYNGLEFLTAYLNLNWDIIEMIMNKEDLTDAN